MHEGLRHVESLRRLLGQHPRRRRPARPGAARLARQAQRQPDRLLHLERRARVVSPAGPDC